MKKLLLALILAAFAGSVLVTPVAFAYDNQLAQAKDAPKDKKKKDDKKKAPPKKKDDKKK